MRVGKALLAWFAAAYAALFLSCSPHSMAMGTETGNGTAGAVMGLSGKPVPGARVTLVPVDYNALEPASGSLPICSTETNARGRYCFPGLVQGCYNLFCDSGANCAYLDSLNVSDTSDDTLPTAFLRKSGSITGSAFISSGRFVSCAFVTIFGSRFFAPVYPDNGVFYLSGLAPGKYCAEIVAQENGFFRQQVALKIDEGQADTIKNPFLLVSTTVTSLQCDSAGVWIGTINGLAHLRKGMWRVYGLPDGLSSSRINCLCGGVGILWAGTSLRLARIRNDTLIEDIFPQPMPALTNITALGEDSSGNVWIGTPQGLFFYNGAGVIVVTGNDALTGIGSVSAQNKLTAVSGILCLHQETIVGTLHGAYFRDSAKAWHEIPEMATLAVSSIIHGGGNIVWFGTNQGVRSWDKVSQAVTAPFDNQATGAVTSLAAGDNDSLYIGTANGLFIGFDSLITKKDLGKGIASVNALSCDRGEPLWAGTDDGIVRIEHGEARAIR